jgi:hypothetical protein
MNQSAASMPRLHRRKVVASRAGQQALEGPENHGDSRSPRLAAGSVDARGQSSRSHARAARVSFYMIESKPENLIGDRGLASRD